MTPAAVEVKIYHCPFPGCRWAHVTAPGPAETEGALADVFGPGVFAATARAQRLTEVEKTLTAHIGTHPPVEWALAMAKAPGARPRTGAPVIVCLCGSTRFMDAFHAAGWERTLAGEIVLSVGVAKHIPTADGGHAAEALGPGVAEALDELHKRKIDLADYVLVLNVGGYIGDSTRSEIDYATVHGKPVTYLEPLQ